MAKTVEETLAWEMVAVIRGETEVLREKMEEHRFVIVNRHVPGFIQVYWRLMGCQGSDTMYNYYIYNVLASSPRRQFQS
jgi:hypothetical protein